MFEFVKIPRLWLTLNNCSKSNERVVFQGDLQECLHRSSVNKTFVVGVFQLYGDLSWGLHIENELKRT